MLGVKVDYEMSAWKKTLIAGLISYIDAGSIVAGASGLSMWQGYLGMSSVQMGLLAALSSNTGGAAIGALIGGKICDKYGRKFVYNYALLFYMIGVAMICLATNYPLFLLGYVIVGLMVGADVVASWTFIAEEAPSKIVPNTAVQPRLPGCSGLLLSFSHLFRSIPCSAFSVTVSSLPI